ncbi:MAG: hypothetical protein M3P98_02445 [bacterium]|nr:hypothetical protein [bacterium]
MINTTKSNYTYKSSAPPGKNFDSKFKPELTPKQMLKLGVFGGSYLNDCQDEFPADWFDYARLSDHGPDPVYNHYEIMASQPLKVWQDKGWIHKDDPKGWFQWYCRYYMGRRLVDEDERQIKRWVAMRRHISQLKKACYPGDQTCRRRQRQALLHWAYDSRDI